ncbi:uncharacterized protein LOC129222848 [Uloborus diversus]|uniref:uncharacterized protein LOC129222848 n=1 Tax=Uloborus diversus TaxID=327109 RepID=UPI00240A6D7A|nr:uncharacterized protein LOC129222848 [Uloborus diversus]
MGSMCSSCCGNSDDDIFERSENDKTNLLGNPVGEPSRPTSESISKHAIETSGDHHEKLNKILQKTANSYIDVPALNSPMDHPIDKTKDYESKLHATLRRRPCSEKTSLLEDTPHIEKTLSEEPLSESDRKMVKEVNSSLLAALQTIQVENTESLVIPFNHSKEK